MTSASPGAWRYGATPALDDFLAVYDEDDNIWWQLDCGHHQNLFEEAVARMRRLERRADPGTPTHPNCMIEGGGQSSQHD